MDRLNQGTEGRSPPLDYLGGDAAALPPLFAPVDAAGRVGARERMSRIVRTIETEIVPRLVRSHQPAPAPAPPHAAQMPDAAQVARFVELLLAEGDDGWQDMIERLREHGTTVETLYLELLAPAAREVGRLWEEDRCPFSDVTVALGRLQRTLRALSPAFGREVDPPAGARRVLLLPAAGEQHTFGLAIVAEFFRRAGWEVVGDAEGARADPAALVRREWFDMVGLTVGSQDRLESVKSAIAAIRRASRNRSVSVLVGGAVFVAEPARAAEVGADATAIDARQAPLLAESLLEQRVARS